MHRSESIVKLLTVVGARPQFVKAAPVSRELERRTGFHEILVHTGQHHDPALSDAQFAALGLRSPDINLGIGGGSPAAMIGRMLEVLDELIGAERPDAVLVYGDTNSTVAGALAATHRGVAVAHVEAGLRSRNRSMPEEANRILTDHLSSLLFAPTHTAVQNLRGEGIRDGVHHVGDVMLDAFLSIPPDGTIADPILVPLGLGSSEFVLATLHRAETTSTYEALQSRLDFLSHLGAGRAVVFPLHPRTREAAQRLGVTFGDLCIIDPVDYRTFSALLSRCSVVATDSGGVQKEAYFHGAPCVTLRSETEWPETIEAGWNRLWVEPDFPRERRAIDEYGSGYAAAAIVDVMLDVLS